MWFLVRKCYDLPSENISYVRVAHVNHHEVRDPNRAVASDASITSDGPERYIELEQVALG